jgi:uncharacterized membrane protein YfcA
MGHWATGAIDWHLMGVLLIGSLPGIVMGSYCAHRVPETALRLVLATTLIVVASNLASHELHSYSSLKPMVGTTNRSMAAMSGAWFRRKVRHP